MQTHDADHDEANAGHLDGRGRFLEVEETDHRRQHGAHARPDRVHDAQAERADHDRVEGEGQGIEDEDQHRRREPAEAFGQAHAGRAADLEHDGAGQHGPGLVDGQGRQHRSDRVTDMGT